MLFTRIVVRSLYGSVALTVTEVVILPLSKATTANPTTIVATVNPARTSLNS